MFYPCLRHRRYGAHPGIDQNETAYPAVPVGAKCSRRGAIAETPQGERIGSGDVLRVNQSEALKDLVDNIYRARCKRVAQKQGWKCADCAMRRPLQGHHVKFRSHGRDDREINIRMICQSCHQEIHGH